MENMFSFLSNELPLEVLGMLLAVSVAVLRMGYSKKESNLVRLVVESLYCAMLSLVVSVLIMYFGLNLNYTLLVSGLIGYLGSVKVRGMLL
jgi:lambda family phage holin|tara:strand:- start:1901 stop:2173 length:273 start_codon:yes stop_codon:yes gene_type:complete